MTLVGDRAAAAPKDDATLIVSPSARSVRRDEIAAAMGVAPDREHRPHLDGLRAVAVYLVLIFHSGSKSFLGGFVGVDVFFVLSGYLVTRVLLRDLTTHGTVRLRRFYARRARRLLLPAVATVLVSAAVFSAVGVAGQVANSIGEFRAALLYSANWFYVGRGTQYFGADNPVLHFWSLAVEEQFYFAWPLVLIGLTRLARWLKIPTLRFVRAGVVVLGTASFVAAAVLSSRSPLHAYFGLDARAYQLALGAMLALAPTAIVRLGRIPRLAGLLGVGAVGAIILSACSFVELGPIQRGMLAAVVTTIGIAALEAAERGPARVLLSTNSLVYLGRVSYGTYLWHWPVVLILKSQFTLSTTATIAVTALIATGIASLSLHMMEYPIRSSRRLDRVPIAVIAGGLALGLVAAIMVVPRLIDSRAVTQPGQSSANGTPVPDGLVDEAIAGIRYKFTNCLGDPASDCTVVNGSGPHLLLIGDSHANMMYEAFATMARDKDLTLSVSVRGACPWPRDLYARPIEFSNNLLRIQACKKFKDDSYDRVIPALDPDIIVMMQAPHEDPELVPFVGKDGKVVSDAATKAWVERTTAQSLQALSAGRRKLVIIEPIPHAAGNRNQLDCLKKAEFIEECRYAASPIPSWLEQYYRQLDSRNARVWSADLDRIFCPFWPHCDPVVNGLAVKWDGSHITDPFAVSITGDLERWFTDNGIFDG